MAPRYKRLKPNRYNRNFRRFRRPTRPRRVFSRFEILPGDVMSKIASFLTKQEVNALRYRRQYGKTWKAWHSWKPQGRYYM